MLLSMPPRHEIELKLGLPPERIRDLWANEFVRSLAAGPVTSRDLYSAYFDTSDLDLRRRGIALRMRREAGG